MRTGYKLTRQDMTTWGGFRWQVGQWVETSGKGPLCKPGWTHWYDGPELAVLMNPIHAEIENPRLWRGETDGAFAEDYGCKYGAMRGRILEEIPLPPCTTDQRVEFGIVCSLFACCDLRYVAWARDWLAGIDRSSSAAAKAAWEAAAAVRAARAAGAKAAWSAAEAAAWSAAEAAAWSAAKAAWAAAAAAAEAWEAAWAARAAVWAVTARADGAMPPVAEIARDILTGRSSSGRVGLQ